MQKRKLLLFLKWKRNITQSGLLFIHKYEICLFSEPPLLRLHEPLGISISRRIAAARLPLTICKVGASDLYMYIYIHSLWHNLLRSTRVSFCGVRYTCTKRAAGASLLRQRRSLMTHVWMAVHIELTVYLFTISPGSSIELRLRKLQNFLAMGSCFRIRKFQQF